MYKIGQPVVTILDNGAAKAPLLFETHIIATEKLGGRTLYILHCFNKSLLKKGQTWDKLSALKREERYSTEKEDIYPTLSAAVAAQNRVYDARIAKIEEERALFMTQVPDQVHEAGAVTEPTV